MPTINAQNWNSSVYVTIIGTPPFIGREKEGFALPEVRGTNRLPFTIAPYARDYSTSRHDCQHFCLNLFVWDDI